MSINNKQAVIKNEEQSFTYVIVKILLIVSAIICCIVRCCINNDEAIYIYMSWINLVALMLSIILLGKEIYVQMKVAHKKMCEEVRSPVKKNKSIMKAYVGMIIGITIIAIILAIVVLIVKDISLRGIINDILGIASLGIALSTDVLGQMISGWWYRYR